MVADGVLTNPLAHATATALALAGTTGRDDVTGVELEMLRANPIESDDTSVALIDLVGGRRLTTAVTLTAPQRRDAHVEVVGDRGSLRLMYQTGLVQTLDGGGAVVTEEEFGAEDLLENLLSARDGASDLLVPIAQTGAFMRLVDAVMTAPAPRPIDERHIERVVDDQGAHLVVDGVEQAIAQALVAERTFSGVGAAFAERAGA